MKTVLEEGTGIVSKRIKAIRLADKSEFGWQTVNEYLSCIARRGERKGKSRISVVVRVALSLVEAPSLPLRMFLRIRKGTLQEIMESVRIQTLPDAWVPVSR